MFTIRSKEEIFELLPKAKTVIKDTGKIPVRDSDYQLYISSYGDFEITPDIQLFGYERSLKENRYVEKEYPELAGQVWMFARSGQGDEWFFSRDTEKILYYDHNKGEYQSIDDFLNFNISFLQFIQIAFLYRDLESRLDETNDDLGDDEKKNFIERVAEVDSAFYGNYPYVYF